MTTDEPDAGRPGGAAGPGSKWDPAGTTWRAAARRTVAKFQRDNLTDLAATLTYYGILSIFPGLLVVVSALSLLGQSAEGDVRGTVERVAPEQVRKIVNDAIDQAQSQTSSAGLVAALGVVVALWSASGYVAAFMRAANVIYDVPEGRPFWKALLTRLGLTAAVVALLLASLVIVVVTGGLATEVGKTLGIGATAVMVWGIVKWPVLILLVSLIFEVLYWAAPNARHRFRWISPGGLLAIVVWLIASGAFAIYAANFGSYNKTYGTLATVVVFLIWMWLSNLAILIGAELDAEVARGRAIARGRRPDDEPYLELRDDRKLKKK